jgi:hypothetical protein
MKGFICQLKQDGQIVAEVDAPTKEEAIREMQHYAMIYSQDGEVEIIKKWRDCKDSNYAP